MAAPEEFFGRVLSLDEALGWRAEARAAGRRVVFTNGCFDIVHDGHAEYLAWARAQGDVLMLGLNDDASVHAQKGAGRPIVPFERRARLLCALRSVDVVVGFRERTPIELIDRVRPDVHVKSDQYRIDDLPERYVVEKHGGIVVLAPHVGGRSTTDIVATIRSRE